MGGKKTAQQQYVIEQFKLMKITTLWLRFYPHF